MQNLRIRFLTLTALALALAALIVACAQTASIAAKHPVEVPKMPLCSDCHTDWRAALSHTSDYATRHKFYAAQQKQTCQLCHADSFCADCHANKEEIKPSDKYKDSPDMAMPHRGDYITQHQIDGRINPSSCFPCHGRHNNERCKVCHH